MTFLQPFPMEARTVSPAKDDNDKERNTNLGQRTLVIVSTVQTGIANEDGELSDERVGGPDVKRLCASIQG